MALENSELRRRLADAESRIAALSDSARDTRSRPWTRADWLAKLAGNAPVPLAYLDADNCFRFVNKTYAARYDLDALDVVGKHSSEVLGERVYQAALPHIRRVLNGESIAFEAELDYAQLGQRFVRVALFPDSESGRVVGYIAAVVDVTDLKLTERALREHDERLRAALEELDAAYDNTPTNLCVIDRDFHYVRVNAELARTNGVSAPDHIGRTLREIVPDLAAIAERMVGEVLATGRSLQQVEMAGQTSAIPGYRRIWSCNCSPLRSRTGEVIAVSIASAEVTDQREMERALRASEEKFRSLFDAMTEGFALCEAVRDGAGRIVDYRYLESNPAFEALIGSRDHTLGRLRSEVCGAAADPWIELCAPVVERGESVRQEYYSQPRSRWFQIRAFPRDGDRFAVMCEDITERKKIEKALRASEERARTALQELEAVYESAPVNLCVIDREFRYRRISRWLAAQNGVSADEHIGRSFREIIPDLAEQAEAVAIKVFETGQPQLGVELVGETSAAPGHQRVWRGNWFPLRAQEGEIIGINIATAEITEQRAAAREREELLAAAESARDEAERSRALLEQAQRIVDITAGEKPLDEMLQDLLELVARALRTDTATILLRRLPGESQEGEDVLRARVLFGAKPEVAQDIKDHLRIPVGVGFAGTIAATGQPLVWEDLDYSKVVGPYLAHDGIRSMAGVPLTIDRKIVGVLNVGSRTRSTFDADAVHLLEIAAERVSLGIMRALTLETRRRAEEVLRETNRRKDEFLIMLAHELRNPLAPIQNAVEVLNRPQAGPDAQQRSLGIVTRQVTHMARLIDDLLDVARISSGKISLKKAPLRISDVVQAAVDAAEPIFHARKHTLSIAVPPHLWVEGDHARLLQILSNLLTNAAKFTPENGEVSVRATPIDDAVEICVTDSGVGVAPEQQERIFDLFVQDEVALDRANGGLGIGLTLVKWLAELHGGSVTVKSEGLGRGSQFIVRLPLLERVEAPADGVTRERAAGSSGLTILVVDDNYDMAESLQTLLELDGHATCVAHDGLEALQRFEEYNLDLAFVDLGLPGLDGYEVAKRLRAQSPSRPLLVALSGYGRAEDKQRAREAGFDYHLTKPAQWSQIESIVASTRRMFGYEGKTDANFS